MSHIRDCPEFRLARSDSKDLTTTCQGLRTDGQRCRRKLASKTPSSKGGVFKPTQVQELFCWQHQDQIPRQPAAVPKPVGTMKGRSSMDSLIDRAGLLQIQDGSENKHKMKKRPERHSDGHARLPSDAQAIRPSTAPDSRKHGTDTPRTSGTKNRTNFGTKFLCFMTGASDDDGLEVVRVRRRHGHPQSSVGNAPRVARTPPGHQAQAQKLASKRRTYSYSIQKSPASSSPAQPQSPNSLKPSSGIPGQKSSQTQYLMSWIPPDLSPETTSKLLQKLGEPLSDAEESGYIYIYCVTPPDAAPSPDAASNLIPPQSASKGQSRRTSDVLQSARILTNSTRYSTRNLATKTITLKIGRAVNVSRRISQQCAHNLTLVRYYPYTPSTPGAPLPRKAPNIHRLERLVHIELADRRVKLQEPCEQCQKRHQEYFEIEARAEQLQLVDECVRRWVRFSEQNA